jgi:hypothetical protein
MELSSVTAAYEVVLTSDTTPSSPLLLMQEEIAYAYNDETFALDIPDCLTVSGGISVAQVILTLSTFEETGLSEPGDIFGYLTGNLVISFEQVIDDFGDTMSLSETVTFLFEFYPFYVLSPSEGGSF